MPRPRMPAAACQARWEKGRRLEITLPEKDASGDSLVGLEAVKVFYLPLTASRPNPSDVLTKGEVVLEQRRPDLPRPGRRFVMDLSGIGRSPGWIVVTAMRVGNVTGHPSETLPWLDPAL
ncbi:MAG: hypothetical protein LWX11_11395 [Firmicutes bacterium]|nr:hypothetical protein [Bacillota bacterium]